MRTAAIATIDRHYLLTNYGSFLQHYALREVLRSMGFKPFRIQAEDESCSIFGMLVDQVKDCLRPLYWALKKRPHYWLEVRRMFFRDISYWRFRNDYEKCIGRFNEPQIFSDDTIGVRGGDQVLDRDSDRRWLCDVKNGNPKVVYSASIDWLEYPRREVWREEMQRRLADMSSIGIRETKGVDVVRTLVQEGIDVEHVADPVQLLTVDRLRQIHHGQPVFRIPTLFCYLVNIRTKEDLHLSEFAQLATLLDCDLKFVGIQGADLFVPRQLRLSLSPRQFLRAIDESSYFITNSYHGSVLAVLYRKNFLSIWQHCLPGTDQNERQKELMCQLGIKDRWVDCSLSAKAWRDALVAPVTWRHVDDVLDDFRNKSLNWLSNALANSRT